MIRAYENPLVSLKAGKKKPSGGFPAGGRVDRWIQKKKWTVCTFLCHGLNFLNIRVKVIPPLMTEIPTTGAFQPLIWKEWEFRPGGTYPRSSSFENVSQHFPEKFIFRPFFHLTHVGFHEIHTLQTSGFWWWGELPSPPVLRTDFGNQPTSPTPRTQRTLQRTTEEHRELRWWSQSSDLDGSVGRGHVHLCPLGLSGPLDFWKKNTSRWLGFGTEDNTHDFSNGRSAINFLKIFERFPPTKRQMLGRLVFFPFLIWENRAIFQGHFHWFFGETSAGINEGDTGKGRKNGVEGIDERRGGLSKIHPKKPKNLWCHWRSKRTQRNPASQTEVKALFFSGDCNTFL